jgi:hypothetical protein
MVTSTSLADVKYIYIVNVILTRELNAEVFLVDPAQCCGTFFAKMPLWQLDSACLTLRGVIVFSHGQSNKVWLSDVKKKSARNIS